MDDQEHGRSMPSAPHGRAREELEAAKEEQYAEIEALNRRSSSRRPPASLPEGAPGTVFLDKLLLPDC
jgi:hypothetical protein